MAEGSRAPLLRAVPGAPMGETVPPASKSQLASARDDDDPHESVTIAPPAPDFEELLRHATPVPSLTSRSDQHFRAALDAGARAGSSLGELSKLVADLSGGLTGAKSANEQLVQELGTLRAMLGSANEQQLALKHRIATLEQDLLAAQAEAAAERERVASQHDEFLSALIEEHEEELAVVSTRGDTTRMSADVTELAEQLVQAETARLHAEGEQARAREALIKAQAQRDEAQARAEKRERERDELRAEASQLRARLGVTRTLSTSPPPPVVASRPPSFRPPALRLDAAELDSTLHTRSSPRLPSVKPRFTPPPAELESAVYRAHESTRPGVGGPKPTDPPPPSVEPPASGWTPLPPGPDASTAPPPRTVSAASLPGNLPSIRPVLRPKLDPTTRPLTDYSLGGDGLPSETLEGVRLSSKPPKK